jgi:hypothetical protein
MSVVCVVKQRSLRRADLSSRGVLPTVVRRCVLKRNLVNEEAIAIARWAAELEKINNKCIYIYIHTL